MIKEMSESARENEREDALVTAPLAVTKKGSGLVA